MYIDFHKYNYELVNTSEREEHIERDKRAYQGILKKWVNDNLDEITERKWEIEEIQYLSEVSDFIKLIREAETLYELGFYTSCIALVGVSAEDFSKYLSLKLGKNNHIKISQNKRLQKQLAEGIIDQVVYNFLDDIRKIRNDCLHYNQDFKQKSEAELKNDAIKSLNNLKSVLRAILGVSGEISPKGLLEIIEQISISDSENAKNLDETKMKIRNATSYLLKFPMAFEPDREIVVKEDYFLVKEIDFENGEITLAAVMHAPGMYVIVELTDIIKEHIKKLNLRENDTVFAIVFSQPNQFGMTEQWDFFDLQRADNFTEIFHEIITGFWEEDNEEEC